MEIGVFLELKSECDPPTYFRDKYFNCPLETGALISVWLPSSWVAGWEFHISSWKHWWFTFYFFWFQVSIYR